MNKLGRTLAATILVIGLNTWVSPRAQSGEKVMPKANSDCAMECMKEKALAGDRVSARDLALIYMKIDFKQMQYWNLIGAENGDPALQYNYALGLLERGSAEQKVRAIFWLKKSAASGDKEAIELLSRVKKNLPLIPPPPGEP